MQRDELTAIGELTGDALAGIAGQIQGVHDGIAHRVWASVGPLCAPVRIAHDLIAAGTYSGVQRSARVLIRTGARALNSAVPEDAPSLERSAAGRVAIGVLNGAVGDTLERSENALALRTTLRKRGQDVEPTAGALRAQFPDATGKLVLFLHGLGETDDAWGLGRERHRPYGSRLRRELGYTPLFIRYNTGRPVSSSGRELAALLERISSEWPVALRDVALIGHSMGGLVARSACDHAGNATWRAKVTHVLTLGSPDRGVPLERAANAVTSTMARVPETRRLAAALGRRSAGLRELRSGGREVPYAPDVEHCFLDYRRFGTIRHLQLLNDPEVYEQIRARLAAAPKLPPARGGRSVRTA